MLSRIISEIGWNIIFVSVWWIIIVVSVGWALAHFYKIFQASDYGFSTNKGLNITACGIMVVYLAVVLYVAGSDVEDKGIISVTNHVLAKLGELFIIPSLLGLIIKLDKNPNTHTSGKPDDVTTKEPDTSDKIVDTMDK